MVHARDGADGARWPALLAVNLAAVIFGSTALFGRLDGRPLLDCCRTIRFAAATLLVFACARSAPLTIGARTLRPVVFTAVLLALHWVSFFASVRMAGVAVGTLTVSTFPLFTILIEAFRKRRWPALIELGAGLAIVGAVWLIAGPGLPVTAAQRAGAFIGLASAACFALFALASQSVARTMNAITLSLYQNALVVLLLMPVLPFVPGLHGPSAWLGIAFLGVFATAFAHQLYLFGLSRLPAAVCGAAISIEPVYAIAFRGGALRRTRSAL
jgi:drug/metabolite transporter (DMT)-like permease